MTTLDTSKKVAKGLLTTTVTIIALPFYGIYSLFRKNDTEEIPVITQHQEHDLLTARTIELHRIEDEIQNKLVHCAILEERITDLETSIGAKICEYALEAPKIQDSVNELNNETHRLREEYKCRIDEEIKVYRTEQMLAVDSAMADKQNSLLLELNYIRQQKEKNLGEEIAAARERELQKLQDELLAIRAKEELKAKEAIVAGRQEQQLNERLVDADLLAYKAERIEDFDRRLEEQRNKINEEIEEFRREEEQRIREAAFRLLELQQQKILDYFTELKDKEHNEVESHLKDFLSKKLLELEKLLSTNHS